MYNGAKLHGAKTVLRFETTWELLVRLSLALIRAPSVAGILLTKSFSKDYYLNTCGGINLSILKGFTYTLIKRY